MNDDWSSEKEAALLMACAEVRKIVEEEGVDGEALTRIMRSAIMRYDYFLNAGSDED